MRRSQSVLPRSFLQVPGNKPELFAKAAAGRADALILDLEDAVPMHGKDEARAAVGAWLRGESERREAPPNSRSAQQLWVRVGSENLATDLRTIAGPAVDGIFLAKCGTVALREAADILTGLEAGGLLVPYAVGIIGLIEDAAAMVDLASVTECNRILTLAIGEVDLMADLRMARSASTEPALDALRTRIVLACAASGLSAPVAPTSTAIRELDAFEESGRKLHDLGFRSRTAVHPSQVDAINRVFTPTPEAVAAARELLSTFDNSGEAVSVDRSGRMVDAAVIRAASETVSRASAF